MVVLQLLQSVGQVSRMKIEKDELIQDKLEGLFKKLQWSECLVPNIPRVPIKSNFYNTCPMAMKLNQSG